MSKKTKSTDSVYRVTEVIGTSTKSWEDAARNAVETAARTLRDLRVAEVVKTDLNVENGKVPATRLEPTRFLFTSADGLSIACVKWSGEHEVRGVVQIAHGLGEHIGRYAELADTLVRGHFAVYGNDHR